MVTAVAGLVLGAACSAGVEAPPPRLAGDAPASERPGEPALSRDRGDFVSDDGTIAVHQVRQMSVVIETPDGVVYSDPTGGGAPYADHPPPDVVLVSHEHHEHYDAATLEQVVGPGTLLVVPPFVAQELPANLAERAVTLANGQQVDLAGIPVEAVPSYGVSGAAAQWHPRGRGNGYVVTVDDRRLYLAGSTQATPEMRDLADIYLAFLPLYPPYAAGPDEAVQAVAAFEPTVTYVYQYSSTEIRDDFVRGVARAAVDTTVVAPDITS